MRWNWQKSGWPNFSFDSSMLEPLEREFLSRSGEFFGAIRHVSLDDQEAFRLELIRDEALKTSEIEGEILNRDGVQSSLKQQFGLGNDGRPATPAERGIAEMMVDAYRKFHTALRHETLFAWHKMIMKDARHLDVVGGYRTHAEPMQIVTNVAHDPKVHFEAPPSSNMRAEMDVFVRWFNDTHPGGPSPLSALTRAGIAHLYFVSIHPFEDGNGRIGRAIAEKALAQNLNRPSLIALAYTIERGRKAYYDALERNNKDLRITDWLNYFGNTILDAQRNTIMRVDFYVAKAKFYDKVRGRLNGRQEKAVARMFREGIDGFKGGLSAENYISITKTSRATATRDLKELVDMGALNRAGDLRHTRYFLNLLRQPA